MGIPMEVHLAPYSKFRTAAEVVNAIRRDPHQLSGAAPGPFVFEVKIGNPLHGPVATLSELRKDGCIKSIKIMTPDGIVFAEAEGGLWIVTGVGSSPS